MEDKSLLDNNDFKGYFGFYMIFSYASFIASAIFILNIALVLLSLTYRPVTVDSYQRYYETKTHYSPATKYRESKPYKSQYLIFKYSFTVNEKRYRGKTYSYIMFKDVGEHIKTVYYFPLFPAVTVAYVGSWSENLIAITGDLVIIALLWGLAVFLRKRGIVKTMKLVEDAKKHQPVRKRKKRSKKRK